MSASSLEPLYIAELLCELHRACLALNVRLQRQFEKPDSVEPAEPAGKRSGTCSVVYGKRAHRTSLRRRLATASECGKHAPKFIFEVAQISPNRYYSAPSEDERRCIDDVTHALVAIFDVAKRDRPQTTPLSTLLDCASRTLAQSIHFRVRDSVTSSFSESIGAGERVPVLSCHGDNMTYIAEMYENIVGDHLRQTVLVPHAFEVLFDALKTRPIPLSLVSAVFDDWIPYAAPFETEQFMERVFLSALDVQPIQPEDVAYLSGLHRAVNTASKALRPLGLLSMDADGFVSEAACKHFGTFRAWQAFLDSASFAEICSEVSPLTLIAFLGELAGHFDALPVRRQCQVSGFVGIVQRLVSRVVESVEQFSIEVGATSDTALDAAELACFLSQILPDNGDNQHLIDASLVLSIHAAYLIIRNCQSVDSDLTAQIAYLAEVSQWEATRILRFTRQTDILADYAHVCRCLHLSRLEVSFRSSVCEADGYQNSHYTNMLAAAEKLLAEEDSTTEWVYEEMLGTYVEDLSRNLLASSRGRRRSLSADRGRYASSSQTTLFEDGSDITDVEEDTMRFQDMKPLELSLEFASCSPSIPLKPVSRRKLTSLGRIAKRRKLEFKAAALPTVEPSSDDLNLFAIHTPTLRRRIEQRDSTGSKRRGNTTQPSRSRK